MFIFLIPASLLPALLASTVGVASIYIYGALQAPAVSTVWLTFWLGDSMGIYIFTPLLVIWSQTNPKFECFRHPVEALLMAVSFILLSLLTFIWNYPLFHLFLPLSLWVAYRFHRHGATLAIFCITLTAIISTSFGYGVFIPSLYPHSLAILISFLGVIVASSLLLCAVVQERTDAWRFIINQNQDLHQTVEMREGEIKELESAIFIKKKLVDSLMQLTLGITKRLMEPLKRVNDFARISKVGLDHTQALIAKTKGDTKEILENLRTLEGYLSSITKFEIVSNRIAQTILEQSDLIAPNKIEVNLVDLNKLLKSCIIQSAEKELTRSPAFTFEREVHLSDSIKAVFALPESLGYAFTQLLDWSISSMKAKKTRLRASYSPVLEVITIDRPEEIEISIRDNGDGVSKALLGRFFGSFVEQKVAQGTDEDDNLNLALAYDIIVHVHNGKIAVDSAEWEYLEFVIIFPKRSQK